MAATKTVYQLPQSHNSRIPRHGVVTLFGYGIRVQVNAGHLLLHDGIADERRTIRLPRVNHGLKRLVMIGSDGFITLEALRWLVDQGAAFVMLDRRGKRSHSAMGRRSRFPRNSSRRNWLGKSYSRGICCTIPRPQTRLLNSETSYRRRRI